MKRHIVLLCVLLLALLLVGCGKKHEHTWKEATCTEPRTCTECGETEGEALGHVWQEATCTEPRTCTVCGETEGEALGHTWSAATCTEPRSCSVCGITAGSPSGHIWSEPKDGEEKTCIVCGKTEREARLEAGEELPDETVKAEEAETVAEELPEGETELTEETLVPTMDAPAEEAEDVSAEAEEPESGEEPEQTEAAAEPEHEHEWLDATCTEPKTCTVCGETEGEALGHEWLDATCTEPKTCTVCGETEGEALGHEWLDATCTAPKTCAVCGETEGEALEHTWKDNWAEGMKTCTVCGATEKLPKKASYFAESFADFREHYNMLYPSFLLVTTDGEDTGFTLKILGECINVAYTANPIYVIHSDVYEEEPVWEKGEELERFNCLRFVYHSNYEEFLWNTAVNMATIGMKTAVVLEPSIQEAELYDFLQGATTMSGELKAEVNGLRLVLTEAPGKNGGYDYELTITLTAND